MTVKLPEFQPWMMLAGGAAAVVAYAYLSGGARASLKFQVGGGQDIGGPELLPWSAEHGCCPVTWDKRGRHSKIYPRSIGPRINNLMCGSPTNEGMGLTSWMAAPPSEETT